MKFLRLWPRPADRPSLEDEDHLIAWLGTLDSGSVRLLELKAQGHQPREIAQALGISERTVRRRLSLLRASACWFFHR